MKTPKKFYIIHDGVKHTIGKDCPVCEQILTERHRENSRKGGFLRLKRDGLGTFSRMGKKGSQALKDIYGPEYFKRLSAAGVKARQAKRVKS